MRLGVLGAGSWGTTIGSVLAGTGLDVRLWARRAEVAEEITAEHRNRAYLGEHPLAPTLVASCDLEAVADGAGILLVAVPSDSFRSVVARLAGSVAPDVPLVSLAKGIEVGSRLRMTQVLSQVFPRTSPAHIGVLTGPNLALEILEGQPTASVLAMPDKDIAVRTQAALHTPTLRVYTNPDVVGAELGGALKNVYAIAAGAADGMGFGDNAKAALITRALAELSRFGTALGGRPATFAGLAGMGDLIATCISEKSRNHYVGEQLGRGHPLAEILAGMHTVAEGVKSSRALVELADEREVEMPIAGAVVRLVHEDAPAADVLLSLLEREAKSEVW